MHSLDPVDGSGSGYRAGACNIGPHEIRRRRRGAYVGFVAAAALAVGLAAADAPAWTRWAVAVPLGSGVASLLQARRRFCAWYGMAGMRNLGGAGDREAVAAVSDRAADRRAAARLLVEGAAVGVLGAAGLVLISR